MTVDKMLKDVIHDEVALALAPLERAIEGLSANSKLVEQLAAVLNERKPVVERATRGRSRGNRGAGRPRTACAIVGCKRPMKTVGYCLVHYQKRRLLERTKRLPTAWKAHAPGHSVKDIVLPRGRAGAKAVAKAKKRAS